MTQSGHWRLAAECSSLSPGKQSGQDLYDSGEEPERLASKEIQLLRKVLKGMEGRWRGEDKGLVCEDNDGRGSKRPPIRSIESEGRVESPSLFLLESTMRSRDSVHHDLLRIELRENRLWVNGGDVGLIHLSQRELSFGYRIRAGGAITELYWHIKSGRRTLSIEHLAYGNGFLISSNSWQLKKLIYYGCPLLAESRH